MAKVSAKKLDLDWNFGYHIRLSITAAKLYEEYHTESSLIDREYNFGMAQAYAEILCPKIDKLDLVTAMCRENSRNSEGGF